MSVTAYRISEALERYAACLRARKAGALRLADRIDRLHRHMADVEESGIASVELVRIFLAELRAEPARYAPTKLVDLLAEMHGPDEPGNDVPLTSFEALLEALRGIAVVERTSLGSSTAVQLRERTTAAELARLRDQWNSLDPRRTRINNAQPARPAAGAIRGIGEQIAVLYDRTDASASILRDTAKRRQQLAVKVLVAGGFGAGKTTMVSAISEIPPLRTEELLDNRSVGSDDITDLERKTTTTVAMDFGRITIRDEIVLYLFSTPNQNRFWFMWDELALGALGAVVLADSRRLADCFPAIDYFERRQLPFVIGVNCFDGATRYDTEDISAALNLDPSIPVVLCDAREQASVMQLIITLVAHALVIETKDRRQSSTDLLNKRAERTATDGWADSGILVKIPHVMVWPFGRPSWEV